MLIIARKLGLRDISYETTRIILVIQVDAYIKLNKQLSHISKVASILEIITNVTFIPIILVIGFISQISGMKKSSYV